MPSRLGHGLYKKIDRLKNIFRCMYITKRKGGGGRSGGKLYPNSVTVAILFSHSHSRILQLRPLAHDQPCTISSSSYKYCA